VALGERLAIAETALGTLRILGLPQPARDLRRGQTILDDLEPDGRVSACDRETRIVRAVVAAAVDTTAADPVTALALATSFTDLATPCRSAEARATAERAQALPELGWPVVAPSFLGWLDAQLSAAGPGRYLAAVTGRLAPADLFQVLRENTKDAFFTGSGLGDAVAAFGLGRFVPGRSPTSWDIDWPTSPRALLLPRPLAPLGSAAIRLRVAPGRTASPALRIEATWEQHADLRLAVVALDAEQHELQRAWIPGRARIPEAQFTFREVTGAHTIVLVFTSLGDPFAPLDTRQLDLEPHGAVVSLASLD